MTIQTAISAETWEFAERILAHGILLRYWCPMGSENDPTYSEDIGVSLHLNMLRSISLAEAKQRHCDALIVPDFLVYGDYSPSGLVSKANIEAIADLTEDLPGVVEIAGGYGYQAIGFHIRLFDREDEKVQELKDTLDSLMRYPSLDDEILSRLEIEQSGEAWENWARADFTSAIQNKLNIEIDNAPEQGLFALFEKKREQANEYWVNESGDSMYIDVRAIAALVEINDIDKEWISFEMED